MSVAIFPNTSFELVSNTSEAQEIKLNIIVYKNNFTKMGGGKTCHTVYIFKEQCLI